MAKLPKTTQRIKTTKLIDKLCAINLMKANMNSKTNNPNYSKVKSLIGVDRKTLALWWQKREEIEKQTLKRGRCNIKSPKFRGKFPEMEDILDAWAKGLRDAGCGFTLKVKALQSLREDLNIKLEFTASDGWLRGFLFRKNYSLRRITTTGRDLPTNCLETINNFHKECAVYFIDDTEFDPNGLVNMDETSVYIDKPSNYTYAKKVKKNFFIKLLNFLIYFYHYSGF